MSTEEAELERLRGVVQAIRSKVAVTPENVERLCQLMHDEYEIAARREGWATQERSRQPWADVPAANQETMRSAVRALLGFLTGEVK